MNERIIEVQLTSCGGLSVMPWRIAETDTGEVFVVDAVDASGVVRDLNAKARANKSGLRYRSVEPK